MFQVITMWFKNLRLSSAFFNHFEGRVQPIVFAKHAGPRLGLATAYKKCRHRWGESWTLFTSESEPLLAHHPKLGQVCVFFFELTGFDHHTMHGSLAKMEVDQNSWRFSYLGRLRCLYAQTRPGKREDGYHDLAPRPGSAPPQSMRAIIRSHRKSIGKA